MSRMCSALIAAVALMVLMGCEGGENARNAGAVKDGSQLGVVTAPQGRNEMPGGVPSADSSTAPLATLTTGTP